MWINVALAVVTAIQCRLTSASVFLRRQVEKEVKPPRKLATEIVRKNFTQDTTSTSAQNDICNISQPVHNAERCFEYGTGRTRVQLQADLHHFQLLDNSQRGSHQCKRQFYLWSFEDFESRWPEVLQCHITTYASIVQSTALKAPCRAASPEQADVLMVPPYLALECNWPAYGAGDCFNTANVFRSGNALCSTQVIHAVGKLQSLYKHKTILLLDTNSYLTPYNMQASEYRVEGRSWAKGNTLTSFYRRGKDFSMPPPATRRCRETPAKAYDEPVSQKRFFVSFKGQMETPLRRKVRELFHNGKDQVIVESGSNYDFDVLLQQSRFNLILRGHVEFSDRFNEAVCSGGVPVLVTDDWIPPFNELMPFDRYGVFVAEKRVSSLLGILKSFSDDEVEQRRKNARSFCQKAFATSEASVTALLDHITTSA